MDNLTMHSLEHLFATFIRSSAIGERVVYFGPMGCQMGFYLLVRDSVDTETLSVVTEVLARIADYDGEMPGGTRRECGNYRNLDVGAARLEAKRYLAVLEGAEVDFKYKEA